MDFCPFKFLFILLHLYIHPVLAWAWEVNPFFIQSYGHYTYTITNNCEYYRVMYSTVMILLLLATDCLGNFCTLFQFILQKSYQNARIPIQWVLLYLLNVLIFYFLNSFYLLQFLIFTLECELLLRPVGRAHIMWDTGLLVSNSSIVCHMRKSVQPVIREDPKHDSALLGWRKMKKNWRYIFDVIFDVMI